MSCPAQAANGRYTSPTPIENDRKGERRSHESIALPHASSARSRCLGSISLARRLKRRPSSQRVSVRPQMARRSRPPSCSLCTERARPALSRRCAALGQTTCYVVLDRYAALRVALPCGLACSIEGASPRRARSRLPKPAGRVRAPVLSLAGTRLRVDERAIEPQHLELSVRGVLRAARARAAGRARIRAAPAPPPRRDRCSVLTAYRTACYPNCTRRVQTLASLAS